MSTLVEETTSTDIMVEKSPRQRRPALVHRKTDPCPMREFVRENWSDGQKNSDQGNLEGKIEDRKEETIAENDGICDSNKNILQEEPFLVSN